MEENKLTAKQQTSVDNYTSIGSEGYNNWLRSMLLAGYSEKYAKHRGYELLDNVGIKQAIEAKRAVEAEKLEHDRDIAIKLLHEAVSMAKANNDNKGYVMAIRELNAISGLHSSTSITKLEIEAKPLTPDQEQEQLKLRLDRIKATKALGDAIVRN